MIEVGPIEESDERAVGSLFRNQSMKFAGLTLRYDRGAKFKKLLELQAPRYQTYLAKEQSQIRSMISVSSGPRWLNGKIQEIGFIGDFRIDHSRSSRVVWRTLLDQVVHAFDNKISGHATQQHPKHFFAVVLKGNKDAIRSLVPQRRKNSFELSEVASVDMVNIFLPWRRLSNRTDFEAARATVADRVELIEFLKHSEQNRQLGYVFDSQEYCEWLHREKRWNLTYRDFLVLRHKGRIQGCTLPWAPSDDSKYMSFTEAPRMLEFGLKVLNKLGLNVPLRNKPIKTLYMTHLNIADSIDKASAISQFVKFIYSQRMHLGYQMISFPDWWKLNSKAEIFRRTLHQRIEVGIFSVGVAGRQPLSFGPNEKFNFEMAVI